MVDEEDELEVEPESDDFEEAPSLLEVEPAAGLSALPFDSDFAAALEPPLLPA